MSVTLLHGDCLEVMTGLADNSVDLILTDPPYFRVKGTKGDGCWWDRQWDTPAGFLAWIGRLCEQWHRLLKPNGSLYVFASPKMAARVEVTVGERFNILNSIAWAKHDGSGYGTGGHSKSAKAALRAYFPQTERIIFAEHHGSDNTAMGASGYDAKCDQLRGFLFEPLRSYLDGERQRAGIAKEDCNVACGFSRSAGGMASRHYFSRSQWCLPTAEHYAALQRLFNANGGEYLRREYEELRREYETLRRPFTVTADVPYTDVWDFPTVQPYPGKHPCEKPLPLLEHCIRASSRPGAVVLDCFMGSGSTGVAATRLGRDFIGIEIEERWVNRARQRLEQPAPRQSSYLDAAAGGD